MILGLHPDLYRHTAHAVVACAVLGAWVSSCSSRRYRRFQAVRAVPGWVMYLFGTAFLAAGVFGPSLTLRWYRRASEALRSSQPTRGSLSLRVDSDIERTSLVGTIEAVGLSQDVPVEDLTLHFPRWEVAPLLDAQVEVSVFVHPAKPRVVALETSCGILWAMPH